jgi:hypothetical protein
MGSQLPGGGCLTPPPSSSSSKLMPAIASATVMSSPLAFRTWP